MFSMDLSDFGADEDHDRIVNKYKQVCYCQIATTLIILKLNVWLRPIQKICISYLQIGFSLAVDLALLAYGSCWTMSSIVLPQLEQQSESGMTITSEEGSWFGKNFCSRAQF